MTTATVFDQRLTRRPDVILGPAVQRGAAPVHLIRDTRTRLSYEMGAKEFFILSRLDGQHTLGEIGEQYAAEFDRRLGEHSWRQLLDVLAQRNLLAGQEPAVAVEAPAGTPNRTSLRAGRIVFGNPAPLVGWLDRRLRWAFTPYTLIPLVIVLVAMEALLARHLPDLAVDLRALYQHPALDVLVAALLWLSAGLHELAHGVTAKHFGGQATEMGVRLRIPTLMLYCRVEDLRLFPSRWQRVATGMAGVVMNLVVQLPVLPLWLYLPGGATKAALGAFLVLNNLQVLENLLPIPPMDGYAVIGYALNTVELGTQSRRYLGQRVRALFGKGVPPTGYPQWTRVVYIAYPILLVAVVLAIGFGIVWACLTEIRAPFGALSAAMLLAIVIARTVGGGPTTLTSRSST